MIKGAIFDFDGTLFDSMHIWDRLGENYLKHIGITPKDDINEIFKPLSLYEASLFYKTQYKVAGTVEEICDNINKFVENCYFNDILPKAGLIDFLEYLYKNGVKMCIATLTDRYLINAALKRCNMEKYFSEIFTCPEVGYGKDNPEIYRRALAFLGTQKNETYIFEDALYAIETAKKDGFTTVGIWDIHERKQKELFEYADIYIKDYREINLGEFI